MIFPFFSQKRVRNKIREDVGYAKNTSGNTVGHGYFSSVQPIIMLPNSLPSLSFPPTTRQCPAVDTQAVMRNSNAVEEEEAILSSGQDLVRFRLITTKLWCLSLYSDWATRWMMERVLKRNIKRWSSDKWTERRRRAPKDDE